jgi:alkyldihydroxyacetonephosphate synthase
MLAARRRNGRGIVARPPDVLHGGGPQEMRWWGWGNQDRRVPLTPRLAALLGDALGLAGATEPPVGLAEVALPEITLAERARLRLEQVVGPAWVRSDSVSRICHSGGKSYLDLVRMRTGAPAGAPDAVVLPASHDQVLAVLAVCAEERVAVVPFGGGTSFVGGLAPLHGAHHAVISLDLGRLAALLAVDDASLTVSVAAGTRTPMLEAWLAEHDLTLGHYPDSFEFASIGGCAATRSVGQASSGYTRIDEAIQGLRVATPRGEMSAAALPANAAGPALRELIIGSEGTLGVITGLLLRVRARPAQHRYEGVVFDDFGAAAEALRLVVQAGAAPDVVRLSDELQTDILMAGGESNGRRAPLGRQLLRSRRGALVIVGWDGQPDDIQRRRLQTLTVLQRGGGDALGTTPGRAWAAARFATPYVRDELLDHGVFVDQFETACSWSGLTALRAAVAGAIDSALRAYGTPPLVGCHIAHVYPTGASLTFTVLARADRGAEETQWRVAKDAASAAIIAAGATISHHHGIGRDHAAWSAAELGPLGSSSLAVLKRHLDPVGVMNPGKVLPDS